MKQNEHIRKNAEKLVEVAVDLLDRRCTLALMIKKNAEKKLAELRESFEYETLCLLFTRESIEAPLNDVIKQADGLIAQSKQMKEMLLNLQDSEVKENERNQLHY